VIVVGHAGSDAPDVPAAVHFHTQLEALFSDVCETLHTRSPTAYALLASQIPAAPRVVQVTVLSVVVPPTAVFHAGSPPAAVVPAAVHSKQIPRKAVALVLTIFCPST
jgi:hypothetical protein